jgi:hypothetical protein
MTENITPLFLKQVGVSTLAGVGCAIAGTILSFPFVEIGMSLTDFGLSGWARIVWMELAGLLAGIVGFCVTLRRLRRKHAIR